MTDTIYTQLAAALDRLPNGFPRTESGVEIKILKKICSPEEAALAGQLRGDLEPVDEIAGRIGLPAEEATNQLFKLVRRGRPSFVFKPCYRNASPRARCSASCSTVLFRLILQL